LESLESGRREISDTESFEGGVLSIGGEHIGWQGQWLLDNPRFVSREFYASMSSGQIRKDDILLVKDGATIGKVAIATKVPVDEAAVNEHVFLLRVRPNNVPKYYFYFVQSSLAQDQIQLEVRGSAQPGLNSEFRNVLLAPRPPKDTQRTIADYLDRETARIDALIAAKERLLELLAEKCGALITRAVTRGLNPHAPLRDSGIPWLGEIPVHWEVVRLRFLTHRIEQGWSPQAENREPAEEEWGVLKLNAVNKGRFDDSAAKALPADVEPQTGLEVCAGDFLMTRSNTPALVGDVCFVEVTRPRLMLCDLIYRLALRAELTDGRFLVHFLSLPIGRRQIESDARGTSASMVKVSQELIKDWLAPLPPVDEQKAIVRQLGKELAPIQRIVSATECTVALLKERRRAIIAAAVSGQIDVEVSA
jgi:type I restriction enzyme S subunit